LIGTAAATGAAPARFGAAQPKATITYWNGPHRRRRQGDGRADRPVHQEDRHQDRAAAHPVGRALRQAAGLGAGGEGPDLALIHTVEVPHFASDGVLEAIDDATVGGKGFRGEDYLPATWQGGTSRASATRCRSTFRSTCSIST
jgi:hypothetical protein